MNKPFLETIAEKIIAEQGNNLHRLCVIFPNRRAALFLRRYLSDLQKKTFIMPGVFSMEDFIGQYTPTTIVDAPALIFKFYRVYRKYAGEKAEPFDEFIKWAQILLKDFSDMDLHLADPEQLLGYLSDARAIEQWNPETRTMTPLQEKYMEFWNSFLPMYLELNQTLADQNLITPSLAYRKMAEDISAVLEEKRFDFFLSAGFNALTLSEEKIIAALVDNGKARLVWDTDEYYADREVHEAGKYIRKYKSDHARGHEFLNAEGFKGEKQITLIGIPQQVGQAFISGRILSEHFMHDMNEKTALVLADENLLFPVLNALPDHCEQPNITMGYPLSSTLFHELVMTLFSLQSHRKFETVAGKRVAAFYYRDVVRLLTHPYLNGMASGIYPLGGISSHIALQNRVMLTFEDLHSLSDAEEKKSLGNIILLFESPWETPTEISSSLLNLADFFSDLFLVERENNPANAIHELEFLAEYTRLIRRLKGLFDEHSEITDAGSQRTLIKQLARSIKIPFYGEPLKGLQIMGMLETRNLDFENLILLSVNEGILPSGKSDQSMIPLDIRFRFGLPTYREQDAIYAYHFYRLIQRARHIYLLYNNDTEGYGKAERSRFITQLLHELPEYNPGIRIVEKVFHPRVLLGGNELQPFEKTSFVMNRLKAISQEGFSPSQLSRYVRCPLQFYYSAVARLGEAEELEETLEASTLGTVIHQMLEDLYKPFLGKNIDPEILLKCLPEVEPLSRKVFAQKYSGGDITRGKNLLSWKIVVRQTERYLKYEAESIQKGAPIVLMNLEETLDCIVDCPVSGEVKLQGKVDRIDGGSGFVRILDYKSGAVKKEELVVKEFEDIFTSPGKAKAFQLCMYAYLYRQKYPDDNRKLRPAIIGLQKISEGPAELKLPEGMTTADEFCDMFKIQITKLIDEIFNKDLPFTPTERPDPCQYCDYMAICARYSI